MCPMSGGRHNNSCFEQDVSYTRVSYSCKVIHEIVYCLLCFLSIVIMALTFSGKASE